MRKLLRPDLPQMSYSLNSLKGGYIGDYIGDYYRGTKGDTRSLDNGSNGVRNRTQQESSVALVWRVSWKIPCLWRTVVASDSFCKTFASTMPTLGDFPMHPKP